MRAAIILLLLAGAGAVGVGVWLQLSSPPPEVEPAAAAAPLAVAEVDFPDPLGDTAPRVEPPEEPPRPPTPPSPPPRAKIDPPSARLLRDTPPARLSADFDDGKLPPWLSERVATGRGVGFAAGTGEKVVLGFERLRVMGMVEGRGGAVVTAPLPPVKGHCLVITKRTRVHAGAQRSSAETSILSADEAARLGGVFYVKGGGVDTFRVGDARKHDTFPPTWDAWFDETITYDPLSGALFLEVDGDPPAIHEAEPASGPVRIGFAASGRGSGHVHEIDRLAIYWEPCELGEGGQP